MIDSFIGELRDTLNKGQLPGKRAHSYVMSERLPLDKYTNERIKAARQSAVLINLYIKEERLFTNLIQRPVYKGHHSGQISFPGGKKEKIDKDLIATAYREAHEEISLRPENLEFVGALSKLYIPPSDFMVYPYVAFYEGTPEFKADPREVENIIEIPISTLLGMFDYVETKVKIGDLNRKVRGFYINNRLVWGATAMIVREFLEVMRPLKSTSGLI